MPKVSEEYIESRRQLILKAAIRCFSKKGFSDTTVQDIRRESGLSHGAIYRYFQSKEDIIEASFQKDQADRDKRYALAKQERDTSKILERLFHEYTINRNKPGEKTRLRFRVQMFGEAVRNPRIKEIQRKTRNQIISNLEQILSDGQKEGSIASDLEPQYIARILAALVDGLYVQMAVDPTIDVSKYVKTAEQIIWGNFWKGNPGG